VIAVLQLIGQVRGDYFTLECSSCERPVVTELLDQDGAIPRITAACPHCKESTTLKLAPQTWPWLVEGR
jgi:NAD-dependent SIR2 family protein deacetylase